MNINVGTQLNAPSSVINEAVYKKLIEWTAVLCERIKSEWGNRSNISDWENFKEYDDNVEGAQMLSCTAGGCSI